MGSEVNNRVDEWLAHEHEEPPSAEEHAAWLASLKFDMAGQPDEQAVADFEQALAETPEIKVPRSVRLPTQLDARVQFAMSESGLNFTDWILRAVQEKLDRDGQEEPEFFVSTRELMRLIRNLPSTSWQNEEPEAHAKAS